MAPDRGWIKSRESMFYHLYHGLACWHSGERIRHTQRERKEIEARDLGIHVCRGLPCAPPHSSPPADHTIQGGRLSIRSCLEGKLIPKSQTISFLQQCSATPALNLSVRSCPQNYPIKDHSFVSEKDTKPNFILSGNTWFVYALRSNWSVLYCQDSSKSLH